MHDMHHHTSLVVRMRKNFLLDNHLVMIPLHETSIAIVSKKWGYKMAFTMQAIGEHALRRAWTYPLYPSDTS